MHQLTLSKGAASLLLSALSIPETFATVQEVYRMGKFCEQIHPGPMPAETERDLWAEEKMPTVEMSEKVRDGCKAALIKHAGKLPLQSPHVLQLLEAFGLTE